MMFKMNIIVLPIIYLASLTLAEPPVGEGYSAARSFDHNHDHSDHHGRTDHEGSPSQEYGPPSVTHNTISNEYGAPNARNAANNGKRTHKFQPPTVRVSFNQRLSSATSNRSNQRKLASNAQGYAAARSGISQTYGPPESRSLSQNYGLPSASTRSLSHNDVPVRLAKKPIMPVASNSQKSSNSRDQGSFVQDYSSSKSQFSIGSESDSIATFARSNDAGYAGSDSYSGSDSQNPSQTYGTPNNSPSSTYGAPSLSPSTSYGVPSGRDSDSSSQDHNSISNSYTAPNERGISENYDASKIRSPSQEYGVPSSRSNFKTDSASPISARSFPSSNYLPAARDTTPSQKYGVPEQDTQGYEQSRARALEELLNQEPANYDFAYQIEDQASGSDFGHTETRKENRAEGSYFVVLPDGTRQTVEYEADERGFKPRISVEPASHGYDDNAQDLARKGQGPY